MSRFLTPRERAIVAQLLHRAKADPLFAAHLDTASVDNLSDGGMGSVRFIYTTAPPSEFGMELCSMKGLDLDGVEINIALSLDQFGRLFELDVWKVDFSAVQELPHADTLIPI